MSDLSYRILVSIIALAIAIGVKKFLPIEDENLKSQIMLLVLLLLIGIFIERKAFNSLKSFGTQLLRTLMVVTGVALFYGIIDFVIAP